ncbi:MAG: mechanosensitive ion channel [Acidimicrobiia bacterium]|nr:mechanosensitive ion channel [Acidimicrobiia bacterium]
MDIQLEELTGGIIATVVVLVAIWLLSVLTRRAMDRARLEATQRYHARRLVRFALTVVAIVALVIIWQPLGGGLGPALGLATAGVAFAMQEVIGAIAGWFNISFGSIYTVGDRIQVGEVRGDVIDISILKTRLIEVGAHDGSSWVQGAQYTGRVVTVSNKKTFTDPVYNYSAYFEYIWDELVVAIPHHGPWQRASEILTEEAERLSASEGARAAMDETRRRFPVPATEVEPLVFAEADEDYMRLHARFVVPIRTTRTVRDAFTRSVHQRLAAEGIEVVSTNVVQQAAEPWEPITPQAG